MCFTRSRHAPTRSFQALTVRASAETGDAATWAGLTRTRLERYPLAGGALGDHTQSNNEGMKAVFHGY